MPRRRKGPREKDLTSRYFSGNLDEDRIESSARFTDRSKSAEQNKILRTALMRAEEQAEEINPQVLPLGRVLQVHSLYCAVQHESTKYLCVIRKTLNRVNETAVVVGDEVRFRPIVDDDDLRPPSESPDSPEGVVEQLLPRRTVLTRADSFKGMAQHPIVANAEQMLIVVGFAQPRPKWGLVDRMIIAAQSGGLAPIVCLNKIDLVQTGASAAREAARTEEVLKHYATVADVKVLRTSVTQRLGIDELTHTLKDRTTVLAGHSGVGKSSLINAIQPALGARIGQISHYTDKGRHTTTSARCYALDFGGAVIDTPGVKLFGLWGVTPDSLIEYFPDLRSGSATEWRQESYDRILESLST